MTKIYPPPTEEVSNSSPWRQWFARVFSSLSEAAPVLMDEQDATNGGADDLTVIDFTGIPEWAKRITIMFEGVSVSGTSAPLVQVGDAEGFETTSYVSGSGFYSAGSQGSDDYTTGFGIDSNSAASANTGTMTLLLKNETNNTWIGTAMLYLEGSAIIYGGAGSKSLSDTLTQVRITTVNGTDTFDAGSINVMYE